jgi:transcriptional regulator with XRE-family HTH domain
VTNVIFADEYEILPGLLLAERQRSGLSQRALGQRMGRSATHVHKIETRRQRIEVVEFCRYIRALGGDPIQVLQHFILQLDQERDAA